MPSTPRRRELVLVLLGGLVLAAGAGFTNTVVLAMGAPPVTHLTGTISRLSADLGRNNLADAVLVGGLVLAFFCGAVLSGAILGSATLRLGRRYGVAALIEATLLAASALLIGRSLEGGAMLAACAAGLQNAMASSYRSLIVRTTHVTGTLTDLGFLAGQRLGGHRVEGWRFGLLLLLLLAFMAGGVAGAICQSQIGSHALWVPAAGLFIGGTGYLIANQLATFRPGK